MTGTISRATVQSIAEHLREALSALDGNQVTATTAERAYIAGALHALSALLDANFGD